MKRVLAIGVLVVAASMAVASAQSAPSSGQATSPSRMSDQVPTSPMTLGTVHIPRLVKADDQPLKAGTYTVRLTGEALKPAVGETPNLEQWVEFLQNGQVKGRAVVSIVPPDEIRQVAHDPIPRSGTARVETLKGDDYLRVWINKGGISYLIHLPTMS